jgi:hypothetical protein
MSKIVFSCVLFLGIVPLVYANTTAHVIERTDTSITPMQQTEFKLKGTTTATATMKVGSLKVATITPIIEQRATTSLKAEPTAETHPVAPNQNTVHASATLQSITPFVVTPVSHITSPLVPMTATSTGGNEVSLAAYLKTRMAADPNFTRAEVNKNGVSISYKVPFWLFGFIPFKLTAIVSVDNANAHGTPRMHIKFPFFAIFGKTDQEEVAEMDNWPPPDNSQAIEDAKNNYDDARDKFKDALEILQSENEHKSQETNTMSGGTCSDCDNP